MNENNVFVVETGIANVASVHAGLRRAGRKPVPAITAAAVTEARQLVLPGVGSFGSAMESLTARGMDQALRERIRKGRPTLAICLGLQLLGEASEESPGVSGLGVLPVPVRRLREVSPVPHMGWNRVAPATTTTFIEEGYAYFANSYAVETFPEDWDAAVTTYGSRFVSALERGSVLGCQFHPELSGAWGQRLLERWLERSSC